jgi:hypothetical protein
MPEHPSSHLLLIACRFAPLPIVSSVRLYHVYKESKSWFGKVSVITAKQKDNAADPWYQLDPDDIHSVRSMDLRRLLRFWTGGQPALPSASRGTWSFNFFRRLANSFPFLLVVGEGGLGYIARAYRTGIRLVREQGVTHLFSSYRPWSDHVVAWLLKRRFPHLVWVADFRDPHITGQLDHVVLPRLQRWFQQRILRRADRITAVSRGVAQEFESPHTRVEILRNGIPAPTPPLPSLAPGPLVINYSGSLYPEKQNPEALFRVLRKWLDEGRISSKEVRLHYAGRDGYWWKKWTAAYGLKDISTVSGQVSLQEARQRIASASLNLVLSWSEPENRGILTAKLFECLAAPAPILALVNGPTDPDWTQIFDELQPGLVVFTESDNEELVEALLNKVLQAHQASASLRRNDPAMLQPWTWAEIIGEFWSEGP